MFEPGWRWSEDVKPIAGTDSCQVHHTGYCVSGQMTIQRTTAPSQSVRATCGHEPGHDAWVIGDEPCIILDSGVAPYAKPDAVQSTSVTVEPIS